MQLSQEYFPTEAFFFKHFYYTFADLFYDISSEIVESIYYYSKTFARSNIFELNYEYNCSVNWNKQLHKK